MYQQFEMSLLMIAAYTGCIPSVEFLINQGAGKVFSIMLFLSNHLPSHSYLSLSLDLECTDWKGWTPLMFACVSGEVDTIRFLLEKGAHIEAEDKFGWTPIIIACDAGDVNVIKTLLLFKPNLYKVTKVK
jgi:ankyrin repeat protein